MFLIDFCFFLEIAGNVVISTGGVAHTSVGHGRGIINETVAHFWLDGHVVPVDVIVVIVELVVALLTVIAAGLFEGIDGGHGGDQARSDDSNQQSEDDGSEKERGVHNCFIFELKGFFFFSE